MAQHQTAYKEGAYRAETIRRSLLKPARSRNKYYQEAKKPTRSRNKYYQEAKNSAQ
jgi:hypothetical protein